MLRRRKFDCAILLQNAFEAALIAWLARIPVRIGYDRDGRRLLLTKAVAVPKRGEIPRHERFYYLELLQRARSEEHTSELQSPDHLVCRLLLEKKKSITSSLDRA